MKITVSVGPAPYSQHLLRELSHRGLLYQSVSAWPRFTVDQWTGNGESIRVARIPWYDRLVWLSWALWRRVPLWGKYQIPNVWLYALHDRLACRFVRDADLFLGWSQVSLVSLREARRRGAVGVLEHPMVHVGTWMSVMGEEYERWGKETSLYFSLFPGPLVRRMEREYAQADYIVVPSTFARSTFLQHGLQGQKVLCVPPGVDVDRFRPLQASEDNPFRIVFVGRMELLKGVHYLLQAFAELALPGAELWLIGPALPEILPFFQRYRGTFRHVGEVPHAEVPAYYNACSVAVQPSINEGDGLVILEAMACGLPMIATDHSGGPDVIDDGVHGFIVPIRDVGALKDRFRYLYHHRREAQAMGERGRERMVSMFTWNHYGQRVAEAYQAVLAARQREIA